MRWRKAGLIFRPDGQFGWINSHAQVPTALVFDDRIRVYFATRPRQGLSLPAFVDLDVRDPARIIGVSEKPLLDLGAPGTFDADGVMPSAVLRDGQDVLLFYSGWSRLGGQAPYNNATGLAISRDGGTTFERVFEGPILDRAPLEPWSATSPAIVRSNGEWQMWYSSGTGWLEIDGKLEHTYVLKMAMSSDGRAWHRDAKPIMPTRLANEAQTRPSLLFLGGKWHMWFSYRGVVGFRGSGESYRMGYATSQDLKTWLRDDAACGIALSPAGWDSQMICYPDVVSVKRDVFMFYNGNGFGEGGFGVAVLER